MKRPLSLRRVFVLGSHGVRQGALIRANEGGMPRHRVHLQGQRRSVVVAAHQVFDDRASAQAVLSDSGGRT